MESAPCLPGITVNWSPVLARFRKIPAETTDTRDALLEKLPSDFLSSFGDVHTHYAQAIITTVRTELKSGCHVTATDHYCAVILGRTTFGRSRVDRKMNVAMESPKIIFRASTPFAASQLAESKRTHPARSHGPAVAIVCSAIPLHGPQLHLSVPVRCFHTDRGKGPLGRKPWMIEQY